MTSAHKLFLKLKTIMEIIFSLLFFVKSILITMFHNYSERFIFRLILHQNNFLLSFNGKK